MIQSFQCDKCGKGCSDWSEWRNHPKIEHVQSGLFLCDRCETNFEEIMRMNNHMKREHMQPDSF